jgi:hypothetical protein
MKTTAFLLALSVAVPAAIAALEDPPPQHVKWMQESGQLMDKIRSGQDVQASAKRPAAVSPAATFAAAARTSRVAFRATSEFRFAQKASTSL